MDEIALHILDIAMNAISAGARRVHIAVDEDQQQDRLTLRVSDDGKGMDAERLRQVLEEFSSDKTARARPIALGIALLRQTAEACGGALKITSAPGCGTQVDVWMQLGHIDRPPLGSMEDTVFTLAVGVPELDLVYTHRRNGALTHFDSGEVRRSLEPGKSLQSPAGLRAIRRALESISGKPCAS